MERKGGKIQMSEAVNMKTDKSSILEPEVQESMEKMMLEKRKTPSELTATAPSAWKMSAKGRDAVSRGVAMFQTGFGLYAAIPLLCKGDDCPYAILFPEQHDGALEDGERCPVEVAFIMTKYDQYVNELDIQPEDAVDMSILRDLIDYDVQIMRADNKMAVEGDFIKDVVAAVDESGRPIYREEVSATANYKEKIQIRRNKSLEMLNSTRKDKAGTKITTVMDPSSYAKELLSRQIASENTMDAMFEELEEIEDVPYMAELKASEENG